MRPSDSNKIFSVALHRKSLPSPALPVQKPKDGMMSLDSGACTERRCTRCTVKRMKHRNIEFLPHSAAKNCSSHDFVYYVNPLHSVHTPVTSSVLYFHTPGGSSIASSTVNTRYFIFLISSIPLHKQCTVHVIFSQ